MPDTPFNNQRLFSDHFLETVVPTLPEWAIADQRASDCQARLRAVWDAAEGLVGGHEGQTEEHWIRPVLRELGYSFQVQTSVPDAEGSLRWPDYALFSSTTERSAAQTHSGTAAYFASALAVADAKVWDAPLDRSTTAGPLAERRNPNFQIDAYLRETDTRWGFVTNGRLWRLYCRDVSYRLDTFFEVDLVRLIASSTADFKYFFLFFGQASLVSAPVSYVDRIRSESQDYAERLSARVKDRVYAALSEFVNGFFAFSSGVLTPEDHLDEAYTASLILLYRILFALYGEAHDLLPLENAAYRETYSVTRIKHELASRLDQGTALLATADNYYADLKNLFHIIDVGASELDVPPYNGGLFSDDKHPFLGAHRIGDAHLARGLDLLARAPSAEGSLAFVDYKTLEIRHLGDIYEGLLEYRPRHAQQDMIAVSKGGTAIWKPKLDYKKGEHVIDQATAGTCYLATENGERRATGSYYTPQDVVAQMMTASLGRVIADLEAEHQGAALVDNLLSLTVCDPAMGSGHFLVEAVDQLARALIRAGVDHGGGAENELAACKRRVVERCVYGVDPNPLAVELAKLSLWLATVARDRPLSFLDAHLVCGNSLNGTTIAAMGSLSGAGSNQMNLVEEALGRVLPELLSKSAAITENDPDTITAVEEKEQLLVELDELRAAFVSTADMWTAGWFGAAIDDLAYLDTVSSLSAPSGGVSIDGDKAALKAQVAEMANTFHFFHWELAFPEVFLNPARRPGFDVVITNPPYVSAIERSARYSDIENAFWRRAFESGRNAFDLYILFMELAPRLCRLGGVTCLITPNKFLAAPYARALREHLAANHTLVSIVDASRVRVFDDPMVYPVITLFRAHETEAVDVKVFRLTLAGGIERHGAHPSRALTLLPENIWAFLLLDDAELLLDIAQRHPQLEGSQGMAARATTSAAEADRFGREVREVHLAPTEGWRVVTTGTIRPFVGAWGLRVLAQQKRKFLRPTLPFRAPVISESRRTFYWSPKLIFKKLALRLEGQLDSDGSYASLNTNAVLPGEVDIFALGALMHSTLLSWIYEGYFGALRMGGGYMQFQAPQLRVLPIVQMPTGPDLGISAVERRDVDELEIEARATELGTAEQTLLYGLLRSCGHEWFVIAEEHGAAAEELVSQLLAALELTKRREDEPAYVLPGQAAILATAEDPSSDDLSRFWKTFRTSARRERAEVTPSREAAVLSAIQAARPKLVSAAADIGRLQVLVDEIVFAMYRLTPRDIERVRRGHEPPPGVVAGEE
jgi:hypothetical protein